MNTSTIKNELEPISPVKIGDQQQFQQQQQQPSTSSGATVGGGPPPLVPTTASAVVLPQNPYAGFDPHAGTNWLFPIDYTTPDYMSLMAEKSLYHNSLVILPNKMEKQFITAVTMYNVYRWYPLGKIIYVTSKRNLLEEQRAACERYMKFLATDVVEINMKPTDRLRYWLGKRVIFVTSSMMLCDMERPAGESPRITDNLKLIVIDEPQVDPKMHSKIVKNIMDTGHQNFRVLCVSTTSSKTIEANLLKTWLISNIELQWGNPNETPEDWLMNKKEISNVATPVGPSLLGLLRELKEIAQPYTRCLHVSKLLAKAEFDQIELEMLRHERVKYEQSILTGVVRRNHHDIMLNFHMAEKLLVGYHVLERDGIIALLEYLGRENDVFVQSDPRIGAFVAKLRQGVYNAPHPKFRTLENFLQEFYSRRTDARVLIVVERLDAGLVIHQMLQKIPDCKHKLLIADGTYLHDIDQFRKGNVNTLIVTVQIEPMLHLGETDLIVLFNMTQQPREFLAHIARTRGTKPGALVIFTTEGPEQDQVNEVINNRRLYYYENRNILPIGIDLSDKMMRSSPSLIPPGFAPKGRQILFNIASFLGGTNGGGANQAAGSSGDEEGVGLPQVGDKRKVVEVLSDAPASYDVVNGQTYYEVVPIKRPPVDAPLMMATAAGGARTPV